MPSSPSRPLVMASLLLLALAGGAGGCSPLVTELSRTCPCSEGWTCCDGQCVEGAADVCPALLPAPPDTVAPEAPRLEAVQPGSPTPAAEVALGGRAEPLSRVRLYAQADCAGEPVAEAAADGSGAFTLRVALPPEATTPFGARALDAAGNLSACGNALAVTHDSLPPAPPVLERASPGALSRTQTQPLLSGQAEPLSRVHLYADAACAQALGVETQADAEGRFAAQAQVAPNAEARFFARATDAAGNASACSVDGLAFRHDDVAPAAPTLTAVSPSSPSRSRQVAWTGAGEPGARVQLFRDAACTQPEGTVRDVDVGGTWTYAFTAAANATTQYAAQALDAAGNASACVSLAAFVHDDRPPEAPDFGYPGVVSPGNSPAPQVNGYAERGASVRIYDGALCGAAQLRSEGPVDAVGRFTVSVPVRAENNRFFARAVDAAGNVSGCSTVWLEYVYDTTPPLPPQELRLTEPSPLRAAPAHLAAVGRAEPRSRVELFASDTCTAPVLGTAQLGFASGSDPLQPQPFYVDLAGLLPAPWEPLFARTTDLAGNPSGCAPLAAPLQLAAEGAWAWGAPEQPPSALTHLAFDGQGHLYAAGRVEATDGTSTMALHRRDVAAPAAAWEEVAVPSAFSAGASLQVNARGDLLLTGGAEGGLRVARFDAAGARWEEPQPLGTPGRTLTVALAALDAAGRAAACWWEQVPAGEPDAGASAMHCSRAAAALGAWEAPRTLSTDVSLQAPTLLPDGRGGLRALWYLHNGTGSWSVHARAWAAEAEDWGADELLVAAVGGAGEVAMDPAGTATFAYVAPVEGGGEAVFMRRALADAAAWGPPTRVSEPRGDTNLASIAAGVAGELVLAWEVWLAPGAAEQYARHYRESEGWGALQQRPAQAAYPKVLPAGPGRAWLVWRESLYGALGSRGASIVVAQRTERGGGLSAPQVVLFDPTGGSSVGNLCAADAQGHLAVQTEFYSSGPSRDERLPLLRVLQGGAEAEDAPLRPASPRAAF